MSVIHHMNMEKTHTTKIHEALCCALVSLGLGAYLAAGVENFVPQLMMFSFPTGSLLIALRRQRLSARSHHDASTVVEPDVARVAALSLDFDILSRAS